ncbi:MAG TPA: YaaL family protein [Candidatus Ligilactobacillus excrementigallinarum]|uniref:YaaL family protein n=1 Tax=Candidatus Ligilactobacillus excrementigallinarum TaxID=2838641 RepID=A0A9D1UW02_9LACO|nr:YaaL family protein [Candidatus Ligilactobacillus excrementigallinarum]
MFGFGKKKKVNKESLKKQYDRKLLADIELAKDEWDNIRNNDDLLATMSTEDYLVNEQLAKAKFEFLFREAKKRKVKAKIQESVIVR